MHKHHLRSPHLPVACTVAIPTIVARAADYAVGADLSFLKQAEDREFVFKDGNVPNPGLQVFKDHGYNWVRLRVFNNPTNLSNDLQYTLKSAQAAKKLDYNYDVIGQSSYPWWQGSLNDLSENLVFMANTYDKDIVVVETAYNWKPTEYLDSPAPFPESPEGQKQFLEEVNRAVMAAPGGRGIEVFWWEPAIAPRVTPGHIVSRGFFDQDGTSLPVLTVFNKFTRGKPLKPGKPRQ